MAGAPDRDDAILPASSCGQRSARSARARCSTSASPGSLLAAQLPGVRVITEPRPGCPRLRAPAPLRHVVVLVQQARRERRNSAGRGHAPRGGRAGRSSWPATIRGPTLRPSRALSAARPQHVLAVGRRLRPGSPAGRSRGRRGHRGAAARRRARCCSPCTGCSRCTGIRARPLSVPWASRAWTRASRGSAGSPRPTSR